MKRRLGFIYRCGACGHRQSLFPSEWDDDQRRFNSWCPECGEEDKIEVLKDGRGTLISTIPPICEAMEHLRRELPSGWFFKRQVRETR